MLVNIGFLFTLQSYTFILNYQKEKPYRLEEFTY